MPFPQFYGRGGMGRLISSYMKIKKLESAGIPGRFNQRLIIREFKTSQDGHEFLNKQYDNNWQEYDGELKAGKYAFAGGTWHNVKKLDQSILAHI